VKYLALKRRRDLLRRRWQYGAVALIIFLGVMMFAASYDAYRNLDASYKGTYERLAFADMTIVADAPELASALSETDGVSAVTVRRQADVPLRIRQGRTLLGRMVGMPADEQPAVNRIDVTAGAYLPVGSPDAIVVETHMAEHFGLSPGDRLEYFDGATWRDSSVAGIAVSPEYIWPARSAQEIFASPDDFGVVFASAETLSRVDETFSEEQILVRYEAGVDSAAVEAGVTEAARRAGATSITAQADQPSNKTLQLDVLGFQQMAYAFPVMFLLAAGMAAYTLLTRLVYQDRSVIGTLRANGLDRGRVVRHYLSFGVTLGLGAAAVGVLVGVPLGWSTTYLYTRELGIPDTVRDLHPVTVVIGLVFGLVAGLLSAWVPARAAARVDPAEAMRGPIPRQSGQISLVERVVPPLRHLPIRWRMVLRGIGRNRRRSLSTVIAVVLALVLILAGWGLLDTIQILLDRQFNHIVLEDASVLFARPVTTTEKERIAAVDGVTAAEVVSSLAVSVRGDSAAYATQLSGYQSDTTMHGFPWGMLTGSGVILGVTLHDTLQVSVGDRVTLTFPDLSTQIEVPVVGFVDEPLGTFAYMEQAQLAQRLGAADPVADQTRLAQPDAAIVAVRVAQEADRAAVFDRIRGLKGVAGVSDSRMLYDTAQQFMGLFWLFVGVMLLFAGLLAFALIFNVMSVNLAERVGELATMRASGVSRRRIASLIVGESLLLTCLGIPLGLVAGWWVTGAMLASYSSDLFVFTPQIRPSTFVLAGLAMVAVTLVSLWPGIRAVGRIDLGKVVRERSV
jgi:putative ABC transport system permease protein